MTNTELAILAHRAGFGEKAENQIRIEDFAKLKKFAEAVAAKEREACAKVCDELANDENTDEYINGADWCSVRIRARGTNER